MILDGFILGMLLVAQPPAELAKDSRSTATFEVQLSTMARDEMRIVSRLRLLREATERLSKSWVAKATNRYPNDLTRDDLLRILDRMELSAAERWTLLLNNLAYLKTPSHELNPTARAWRKAIDNLPGLQRQINIRLDEFNSRLKDGILMNLANKLRKTSKSDSTPRTKSDSKVRDKSKSVAKGDRPRTN